MLPPINIHSQGRTSPHHSFLPLPPIWLSQILLSALSIPLQRPTPESPPLLPTTPAQQLPLPQSSPHTNGVKESQVAFLVKEVGLHPYPDRQNDNISNRSGCCHTLCLPFRERGRGGFLLVPFERPVIVASRQLRTAGRGWLYRHGRLLTGKKVHGWRHQVHEVGARRKHGTNRKT
jgi:hypothetical protein